MKNRQFSPVTLFETLNLKLKSKHLSVDDFSRGKDRFINVCTDVVLVDKEERFVLPRRIVSPARGWWWMGGGMHKGETTLTSLERILRREIGFTLDGVTFLTSFFHQWETRKESPCSHGQHDFIFLHFCKVDEELIAHISLDPKEYDKYSQFMRYDGSQIVRPAISNAYELYRSLR